MLHRQTSSSVNLMFVSIIVGCQRLLNSFNTQQKDSRLCYFIDFHHPPPLFWRFGWKPNSKRPFFCFQRVALALVKGNREPQEAKKKSFDLGGNRTHDLRIRSTVTLPTELQGRTEKVGDDFGWWIAAKRK